MSVASIRQQIAAAKEAGFSPRAIKSLGDDLKHALALEAAHAKAAEDHPDVAQMRAQLAALNTQAAALPVGDEQRDAMEASAASIAADIERLQGDHTEKRAKAKAAAEAEAAEAAK